MKEDKDEDQKRNNSLGTVIKDLNYCLDVLKMKIEEIKFTKYMSIT